MSKTSKVEDVVTQKGKEKEYRVAREGEGITEYRIRMLELETDAQGAAIDELSRLRRDGAIAVGVLLCALAITNPVVWGMVVMWASTAASLLRDWRS